MPQNSSAEIESRLNVIESNNLESLADMCAMIMASYPLSDVFMPEKVIVMNLGMKNFLTQRITIQNKISAMCDFKQVWQLIYTVFYELNPEFTAKLDKSSQPSLDASSFEDFQNEFRYNFYDREHIKWNIYSQICRRPRQELKSFVSEYEQSQKLSQEFDIEPLKFFDNEGPYKIDDAQNWLKEHQPSEDETQTEAASNEANKNQLYDDDSFWSFINLDNSELFDRIKDYVKHDKTDERAYELAAKLADTFDQYQIYRPHWILDWNNFSLQDFEAYEKDPDDPKNPINIFIEKQCTRYVQRKSGFFSAKLRQQVKDLKAQAEAEVGAEAAAGWSDGAGESNLNVSAERKAQAAISEAEQEQAILKASVETIRNSFKQNVWQMKLWCLLRPGISLPKPVDTHELNERRELEWYLSRLDRAQVLYSLISQLLDEQKTIKLPFERVFIFGVSALPQVVIDFFSALARHCQVFLMLFNPTQEFWADIRSDNSESFKDYIQHIQSTRQVSKDYLARLRRKFVRMPSLLESLKREDYDNQGERVEGHPLLLSYGKQCKDMINMLLDVDPPISTVGCFSEPLENGSFERMEVESSVREKYTLVRGGTLLKYLQTTIFELKNEKERYEIALSDRSFVVHSCYTLRREVETLRDNLLRLFNEHRCPYRKAHNVCTCEKFGLTCQYKSSTGNRCQRSNLLPRDIVVMVPAINTYAPHISAVFGGVDPNSPDYIPFVVSDQTETEVNTVAQALLRLLEINSERITSVMVIELLNEPAIACRFGISPSDVDVISSWLTENNVYWGLDKDDTQEESEIDIPGSFSLGLDRMVLGSLLGETTSTPCFSEIEGNDAVLLGKFWDFIQALRELRQYFTPEMMQTPNDWEVHLQEKLRNRFFDDSPETVRSLHCVDNFITNLKSIFSHLKKPPRLTLQVFAIALRQGLTAVRNFTPYYGERVNFCTLIPMRAVPFKHVFILGLNDIDFPRQTTSPAFNLIATKEMFERGDRSPALDDRFLFLEALLSARESLYLSYIGQSPIDQTERNPSIVLTELLYFISDRCQLPLPEDQNARKSAELDLGKAVLDRLVIKERLNAYHMDNYTLSQHDGEIVKNTKGSLQAKVAALVEANDAESEGESAAEASESILMPQGDAQKIKAAQAQTLLQKKLGRKSKKATTLAQQANALGVQPYELVLEDSQIWRMPSFNRSFINLQQAVRCNSPILGEGNFSVLVGLPEQQIVDLSAIMAFCKSPCRMFMQRKLGLSLAVNNKTELAANENFAVDSFQTHRILQDLINLPPGEQEQHLEFLSEKGELPYGVFKELLKEEILPCYQNVMNTLELHGLKSAREIERFPSAAHYELQLYVPVSAIYGESTLSPREIVEKYNHQGVKHQLLSSVKASAQAGQESGVGSIASGAEAPSYVAESIAELPETVQQLSETERAQPKFVAADGEQLLDLHLSIQIEARSKPIIIDSFGKIKTDKIKNKDAGKQTAAMIKANNSFLLTAVFEAIAQYLYEPFAEALLDPNDTQKSALAKVLPANSALRQPACSPARLKPITIIDREGNEAVFDAFASGQELEHILKQLVIFYLQASCSPFPGGRTIIRNFTFVDDPVGDIALEISDTPNGANQAELGYDKEAAYFFHNAAEIEKNHLLKARLANFMNFLRAELVDKFNPFWEEES